jgi:hypothetical protein
MSRLLENRPRLVEILSRAERIIYYGAAFALILTVAMIFASAAISAVEAIGAEPLETALIDTSLTVLDRVLLIFIFVELLNTIGIVVREREIVAEPFETSPITLQRPPGAEHGRSDAPGARRLGVPDEARLAGVARAEG